jgi:hypothetical protein
MNYNLLAFVVLFGVACSPKVATTISKSYPVLDYKLEVIVIGLTDEIPRSAEEIGTIKIGDTGFSTNCGWDVVIEKAKIEARKAGGNALKIIEHKLPSAMGSSCDRITAKILRIDSPDDLMKLQIGQTSLPDTTWGHAKLFVFRPSGYGSLVGYDLYLGDSLLCRVKSNTKIEVKLSQKGPNILWAKTESKEEVPITIEHGREYYLKCGMGMGVFVGRPKLELVERNQGNMMYNALKNKN